MNINGGHPIINNTRTEGRLPVQCKKIMPDRTPNASVPNDATESCLG
jgi:hypothetical protein